MSRVFTIAMLVCVIFLAAAGLGAAADRLTPVLLSTLTPPSPVRGTDGLIYLQYELLLTSYSGTTFEVERIEVLDARTRRVVSNVSGAAVQTRLRAFTGAQQSVIGPAQTAAALLFPTFATMAEVPRGLVHRVTLKPERPTPILGARLILTGAPVRVDFRPPLVLGPPLEGPRWYASGSCCLKGHSSAILPINGRLYLSQRYAIDWVQLDARGRAVAGDLEVNANWIGYGARLLAVRDGTVVSVRDGLPDGTPGKDPPDTTLQNITGNHVVLGVGGGAFVLYAHMKPGSVRVRPGQRVRRGQVLGLLGNSGNSDGPHLHLQLMDGPSPLASRPLPYVFDRLTARGKVPAGLPDEQVLSDRGAPIDAAKHGRQRRVLPMHKWIVDFPTARR